MKDRTRHMIGIAMAAAALACNMAPALFFSASQENAVETGANVQPRVLIPGGQVVGVAMKTQGVLVVAKSGEGRENPLHVGDVILGVEGESIDGTEALSREIGQAQEDRVRLDVLRGGKTMTVEALAPVDPDDGRRRLGVWVRDSTAGVGTLSYIDPVTGAYGALGHAIVDADTGDLLTVKDGAIMRSRVVGVVKGEKGKAGELRGSFLKENEQIGTLSHNCSCGIYGGMEKPPQDLLYPQGLPVAARGEVHPGAATILSTVDEHGPKEYRIEIRRCYDRGESAQKGMLIEVTDSRLIEKTGGIVQGMSGSPIIQNGKLVGAVTHVLVNDPTRGYGIFIENMLDAAE